MIAWAKFYAVTGSPVLKRNPSLIVNVYVRRSRDTFGYPVDTSGFGPGNAISCAHVGRSIIPSSGELVSAGSIESTPTGLTWNAIRNVPP